MRFVLLMLCLSIPIGANKDKAKSLSHHQQAEAGGEKREPLIVQVNKPNRNVEESAEDEKRAQDDASLKHRELWLTVAIAFAAFCQVGAAIWQAVIYRGQSRELKIQRIITHNTLNTYKKQSVFMETQTAILAESVSATKEGAKAAQLSLDMSLNQARARISIGIVSIEWESSPRINFSVISHGPTHALIDKAISITTIAPVRDFEWDFKRDLASNMDLPYIFSQSVNEQWGFIFYGDRLPELHKEIEDGNSFLHFRARVDYRDVFGTTHTTCVAKYYGRNSIYSSFSGWYEGPPEYNYAN